MPVLRQAMGDHQTESTQVVVAHPQMYPSPNLTERRFIGEGANEKEPMEHHKCGCVTYYDANADGYEYAEVCDEHWAAKYNVDYDPDASREANLAKGKQAMSEPLTGQELGARLAQYASQGHGRLT